MRKQIREVDFWFEVWGWMYTAAKWVILAGLAGFVAGMVCGYSVMP